MRKYIAIGALCAMTVTAWANVELFGIARDLNDHTHLIKIDPTNALSMQVVAPLNVEGVSWLGYDPTTHTLIVHNDTQAYHVDPATGEATAFAQPAGVPQMQGVDYVPGLGLVTAFGPQTQADKIGQIHSDGTVSTLYDTVGLNDFDELVWDGFRDQIYISATQQKILYTFDEDTGDLLNTISLPAGTDNILRVTVNPETGVMYGVSFIQSELQNTIDLLDPVTGEKLGSIGTLPGYNHIHGLAFTPEPSSIMGLILVGISILRRRAA